MADQSIVGLANLASPNPEDLLAIVDMTGESSPTTKNVEWQQLRATDPNRPTAGQKLALAGTSGTPGTGNEYVTDDDPRMGGSAWSSMAYGSLTFTSNSGTWSADSGDLSYYKWIRLNAKTVAIKIALVGTTVSGAGSELRVTAPTGVTFGSNDSFGFTVWTVDGFSTQDVGQVIARTSTNLVTFKRRDGAAWGSATDLVAVIANFIAECTVVP